MIAKYIYTCGDNDPDSAKQIAPILFSLFKPDSVIDIGCGTGIFLKCFKDLGVKDVFGIDGKWVDKNLLFQNVAPSEFVEADLEKPLNLGKKYDLVLCLEVAEHLSKHSSDGFINNLTKLGDIIIFSAAIPFQGGYLHVNEQWIAYWQSQFQKYDYEVYDVLRKIFWNNEKIKFWYRQNIFLVANKNVQTDKYSFQNFFQNKILDFVHPELYLYRSKKLFKLIHGEYSVKFYWKLLGTALKKKWINKLK
jgi:SAM-dependent methyltransferase